MVGTVSNVAGKVLSRSRWRLHRAGIVNVYQYENEVINFAGGRLLLRGVNGSGKSTAMNMLLPFLLTAKPSRIDAAGEQRGILKSWMLNGRDDVQPVGYLWIEFEHFKRSDVDRDRQRQQREVNRLRSDINGKRSDVDRHRSDADEFLVCGCGIKANRNSDRVTTWWFITSKRPGIDIDLVEQGVPVSADRLRLTLEDGAVFTERQRGAYRRVIEQKLFNGASMDQHIKLIHEVRSPRVGDRIDVNLPAHLVDALPGLSEHALSEAAEPLEDLEEHRRNVADLEQTLNAVKGILKVYRSYCVSQLRHHVVKGHSHIKAWEQCVSAEEDHRRLERQAIQEVARFDGVIAKLEINIKRLDGEISALEESQVYSEGKDLNNLRALVASLDKQREDAASRVNSRTGDVTVANGELKKHRNVCKKDLERLNIMLSDVSKLSALCQIDLRVMNLLTIQESVSVDDHTFKPLFEISEIENAISTTHGDVHRRQQDITEVEQALAAEYEAFEQLLCREAALEQATDAVHRADKQRIELCRHLDTVTNDWKARIQRWACEIYPMMSSSSHSMAGASGIRALADPDSFQQVSHKTEHTTSHATGYTATTSHESLYTHLREEVNAFVEYWRNLTADIAQRLKVERESVREAQKLVDELNKRNEPDPPRLAWQTERRRYSSEQEQHSSEQERYSKQTYDASYCLADLIDFADDVDGMTRAGIEAALEASGLLAAQLVYTVDSDSETPTADSRSKPPADSDSKPTDAPTDGAVKLTDGQLLVVSSDGVSNPLSKYIVATVPDRLHGKVDKKLVDKLLNSISCDLSSEAHTAIACDGEFKIGNLRGRYHKSRAEFVGSTARRAALQRSQEEAGERLRQACVALENCQLEYENYKRSMSEAQRHETRLPSLRAIVEASADVKAVHKSIDDLNSGLSQAKREKTEAEQKYTDLCDKSQTIAVKLKLPRERNGLAEVRRNLHDLKTYLERCSSYLTVLQRSVNAWDSCVSRWQQATTHLRSEQDKLDGIQSQHEKHRVHLDTIVRNIGVEYDKIVIQHEKCTRELEQLKARLPETRLERDEALKRRAASETAVRNAAEKTGEAEKACESMKTTLSKVCATPGFVSAIIARLSTEDTGTTQRNATRHDTAQTDTARDNTTRHDTARDDTETTQHDINIEHYEKPAAWVGALPTGSQGLRDILHRTEQLLLVTADHTTSTHTRTHGHASTVADIGGAAGDTAIVADSVRQSLKQRRDSLGAGWDAEERQPDPALPLVIEVTGPLGKAPLPESLHMVARQHQQLTSLLDRKQDNDLRELLQGMIAREIADKVHGAQNLVDLMNERLQTISTAHQVGIRLRWRRSPELDPATEQMVKLFATLPDLRTEDENLKLRQALSRSLDEARAAQPDAPYRHIINETFNYKQWHEMSIMLKRAGEKEKKLSRNTPLSEGEKRFVTYLPLFAAVAASCDALAMNHATHKHSDAKQPGIARFVLLDDAFAKVSEDNHAALLGLIVELDLDLIATSERLWGAYDTVPELAIVEVVRDVSLGVILLEHYQWSGNTGKLARTS